MNTTKNYQVMTMSEEKSKGGRPTTDQVADREWGNIIRNMKAKSPKLMMKAMQKYEDILDNNKSSESAILRAASGTFDVIRYLHDLEKKAIEQEDKLEEEEANATGVSAAITPLISLVPPAKVG